MSWVSCSCREVTWRGPSPATSGLEAAADAVEPATTWGWHSWARGAWKRPVGASRERTVLRPDLAGVRNNLGLARLNQGQPREAREQFEEAIPTSA